MARQEVKAAVKKRLEARFGEITFSDGRKLTVPVYYPNDPNTSTPVGAGMFVQVQYPVSNTIPAYLSGASREEGVIRLIIHQERDYGTDDGDKVAKALADLFTYKRFDGIETFVPSSPVEDDRSDNGPYFTTSITIPYHCSFKASVNFYD